MQDGILWAGEPVAGVRLQGGQLPHYAGEVAGHAPGNVLRVLWSHLRQHSSRYSSLRASASSRSMIPLILKILPSHLERDLPATEPALPAPRVRACLAASSTS